VCISNGNFRRSPTRISRSDEFLRGFSDEEGLGAALIGPNKAGTGETLHGVTAPAFSAFLHPPVLELAVRLGLQPSAQFGRPGSIPGWGITFTPSENRCDNSTKCPKSKS
jgi:hypothetical protein